MLVDSHCHLDRIDLEKDNLSINTLLAKARARGVSRFLTVGVDLDSSRQLIELAEKFDDVFVSVGAHPLQEKKISVPSVDALIELGQAKNVIAIGETGFDNHYSAETAAWQKESFINHMIAAAALKKPLIVHTRKAQQQTLDVLREHGNDNSSGILHCFTESWSMAKAALDMNFYISFSGIITFKNAGELREVVKKVPLERLLVETDSPWLTPVPYRGKQNQPQYVVEVAQQVAELKGIPFKELARITTENFNRLFFSKG